MICIEKCFSGNRLYYDEVVFHFMTLQMFTLTQLPILFDRQNLSIGFSGSSLQIMNGFPTFVISSMRDPWISTKVEMVDNMRPSGGNACDGRSKGEGCDGLDGEGRDGGVRMRGGDGRFHIRSTAAMVAMAAVAAVAMTAASGSVNAAIVGLTTRDVVTRRVVAMVTAQWKRRRRQQRWW
jgi:hypothetical protein